jgi:hypothetical protein
MPASHGAKLLRRLLLCSAKPLQGVLEVTAVAASRAPHIHALDDLVT